MPPSTTNLLVQAVSTAAPVSREEQQQSSLLLYQMVRATVQEGGQEKALLQFGDHRLWVATGTPLKAGDTLNLQVVETEPKVVFKIILAGSEPGAKGLGPQVREGLTQLLSLLQKAPGELDGATLSALPKQLGLYYEADLLAGRTENAQGALKNALGLLEKGNQQQQVELKNHLSPLLEAIARLPELLPDAAGAPAGIHRQSGPLAAILRPLLHLAQSLPDLPVSPRLDSVNAAHSPRPDAASPGTGVSAFVRALGDYLAATTPLSSQALNRLEQELGPLSSLLRQSFSPESPVDSGGPKNLLGQLLQLFRGEATRSVAVPAEISVLKLAGSLQTAVFSEQPPEGRTAGLQPSAELIRLAQVLVEIPGLVGRPDQVVPFLEKQSAPVAAVLRPLLQLAEVLPASPEGKLPSSTGMATSPQTLTSQETAQTVTELLTALRSYLEPFRELTDASLERIEQQLMLLSQIQQGSFETALAAIGQKPLGKDLLGALFYLFRATPEKLHGVRGSALSKQLAEVLQKTIEQGCEQTLERQEESLRQIELWQLCRARLGDIDTSFIPLPLPFVENGFLLARRQQSADGETGQPEEIVTFSVLLELQLLVT
ncbi:MAG: hypothetical protein P8X63_06140, partial [Desulfuromonadaceae bacterium]